MNEIFFKFKQKHETTCGIATARIALANTHGIIRSENSLVRLAEKLYVEKYKESFGRKPEHSRYKIKKDGAHVYHFRNIGEYFGLGVFRKCDGEIEHLKYLIDNKVIPIVHRSFEEDGEGHYVAPYGYDHGIYLFDPARGSDYGSYKESYDEFYEKWLFNNERWFLFFYEKGNLKIPFKGKYLV